MRTALVAIQLAIDADVLASADAYRRHLQAATARALDGVGSCDSRLVVFPEVAGHLAVFALAPPASHKAKTLQGALASAAVRRPLDVLRGFTTARTLAPSHAVLAAVAPDAEHWWKSVFGPLAKEYRAYIVAGSHFRLAADGALTNSSMLFGPDGFLVATTDKVNLLPGVEDAAPGGLGLHRGSPELPIVDTPFGKLATVIGYDAFAESLTPHERFVAVATDADVVANPAANPRPEWRENLRAAQRVRVTAHLVGGVLDQHFAGTSQIVDGNAVLARMNAPDRGGFVIAMLDTENV